MALRVWVDDTPVGRLDRTGHRGSTFVYDAGVDPALAVSLTMPPRTASYDMPYGMLPAFETSLPEGVLLAKIKTAVSKRQGSCDAMDVLTLTGSNQIGRVRVLPEGATPARRNLIGDISDLLKTEVTPEFVEDLLERYGLTSGVSGVMPKVLMNEQGEIEKAGRRITTIARDWIVKVEDRDYPGLCLNEFWWMEAARKAGLEVARTALSVDRRMLLVRRFDETVDGRRCGFEDFCALNAKPSEDKYAGSLETSILKRISDFSGVQTRGANLEAAFRLMALNLGIRNGDDHLKNFALLFDDATGPARLAPAYDLVTTTAFIPDDLMALTLNGTKRWPTREKLLGLAVRAKLPRSRAEAILEEVGAGLAAVLPEMVRSLEASGLPDLGEKMAAAWREGAKLSLGVDLDAPAPSEPEPQS